MLKKIISAVMVFALMITGIQISVSDNSKKVQAADSEWKLVWSDDFDGTSLDTGVWNYDTGAGGWGNSEIQHYTDKNDNVSVSDGLLKITAKKESYKGSNYTSGRLTTKGKKAFKYGKMEARIKVEGGNQNGVWPAFWMMGNDGSSWPYCGEVDIMEHSNNRNYVEGTIHWNSGGMNASYNHVYWGSFSNGNYYHFSDNENNGINGWHTYGILWDEEKIQWYVDDNVYLTAFLTSDNAYAFQKEQYFLLNLALGGPETGYTGGVTVDNNFQSAIMYVDYVRAYQGGSTEVPTSTDGLTDTTTEKTNLGGWGYYLFGGNAGRYSGGTSLDEEFTLKITNNNKSIWGVQAFTKNIDVTKGHKYVVSVDVDSDSATGAVLMKDEIGGTEFSNQGLIVGNNTLTGTFTANADIMQFMFNLAEVNAGTTLKFHNVKVTDVTDSEPVETTTKESQEGGDTDYSDLSYIGNETSEVAVAPLEDFPLQSVNFLADGRIEVIVGVNQGAYTIFPDFTNVTLNGTKIPDAYYGSGAAFYIPANHDGLKYNDYNVIEATSAVNSKKFHIVIRYGTPDKTEPETTTQPVDPGVVISEDVDILGYQMNTTLEGVRVVAMVEPMINKKTVRNWGFVYGLKTVSGNETGITDDDMVVGSTSKYIQSYESTQKGTLDVKMGDSDTATYFERTMLFGDKNIAAFTAQYNVRVYAVLEDGSYVYSSIAQYSIGQVADRLYKNKLMNTKTEHDYLYQNILKVIDSKYAEIDYSWGNSVVRPDSVN